MARKRKMALSPAISQVLRGAALWTPARSLVKPRMFFDARNAVWSGANLTSIVNSGIDGGAVTVNGPPTQGTAIKGIFPILADATGEFLSLTLGAWNTGKISAFWFGRLTSVASGGHGILNKDWANTGALVLYATVVADGVSYLFTDYITAPSLQSTAPFVTSTATAHSLYVQTGATNLALVDGTSVALSGTYNATGTVQNYSSGTWEAFRGDTHTPAETLFGETFALALFDKFLPKNIYQKWEGYYANLLGLTSLLPASHPYKSRPPRV